MCGHPDGAPKLDPDLNPKPDPAGGESTPVSSWLAPAAAALDVESRGFMATLLSDSPLQTPSAWSVHHVPAEIVAESAHTEEGESSFSCISTTPIEAVAAASDSASPAGASPDAAVAAARLPAADVAARMPADIVAESAHAEEEKSSSCVPATPPAEGGVAATSDSGSPADASTNAAPLTARLAAADVAVRTPLPARGDGADGAVAATLESGATPASSGACSHAATCGRVLQLTCYC